jgi:uncharacterized membrane protein YdfJ with MMPL/SSD domain
MRLLPVLEPTLWHCVFATLASSAIIGNFLPSVMHPLYFSGTLIGLIAVSSYYPLFVIPRRNEFLVYVSHIISSAVKMMWTTFC